MQSVRSIIGVVLKEFPIHSNTITLLLTLKYKRLNKFPILSTYYQRFVRLSRYKWPFILDLYIYIYIYISEKIEVLPGSMFSRIINLVSTKIIYSFIPKLPTGS